MWLIDRYIARRFLANFFILLVMLYVFAVSIDLILQLDEFVKAARERVGPDAGLLKLITALIGMVVDFHGPRIFQFYAYMVGLVSVGAMGFTFAQMHRAGELVAMLSSGVQLHRVAVPVLVAAFALNVVQFLNQELVLPELAPRLIRSHGSLGRQSVMAFEVRFAPDGRGSLFQSSSFDPEKATLAKPTILVRERPQFPFGRTVRRITGDLAVWDEEGGGWRFTNGRAIILQEDGDGVLRSGLLGQTVELYPTDLTPQVLTMRHYRQYATMLSLRQIRQMMRTPGVVDADALVRFYYARFSTIMINMLLLVICLPFFLLREPGDLFLKSVLCAATAIPAMMGALIGFSADPPGVPPQIGAFLPAIVLVPIAVFMAGRIKT